MKTCMVVYQLKSENALKLCVLSIIILYFPNCFGISGNKTVRAFVVFSNGNQRTIGPENAHLKPDLGVLSHHEMTLTLNTHTPLLNS